MVNSATMCSVQLRRAAVVAIAALTSSACIGTPATTGQTSPTATHPVLTPIIRVSPEIPVAGQPFEVQVTGLEAGEEIVISSPLAGPRSLARADDRGVARLTMTIEALAGVLDWEIVAERGETVITRTRVRLADPAALATPLPSAALRPGLLASFGAPRGQNRVPDSLVAAGRSRVLIGRNDLIALYDKTGLLLAQVDPEDFYTPPGGWGDPWAIYDPESDRFFHVLTSNPTEPCEVGKCVGYIHLSVSRSGSPSSFGAADWHRYQLDLMVIQDQPTDLAADFSRITVTKTAVLVAVQQFAVGGGNYSGTKIRVLPKDKLIAGEPVTSAGWVDVLGPTTSPDHSHGMLPAQPIAPTDEVFFVSAFDRVPGCRLTVWRLDRDLSSPQLTSRSTSLTTSCESLPLVDQPENAEPLDHQVFPFIAPVLAGRSLWGALTVVVEHDGERSAAVRWYQVDVSAWPTIRLVQSGLLTEPRRSFFYPTIAATTSGDVILAFNSASRSEHASFNFTGRLAADPPGTMRPIEVVRAGEGIHRTIHSGRNRFADFSGSSLEPDESSVWAQVQYATGVPNEVRTWVARLNWDIWR